jgi:hypothetical protein
VGHGRLVGLKGWLTKKKGEGNQRTKGSWGGRGREEEEGGVIAYYPYHVVEFPWTYSYSKGRCAQLLQDTTRHHDGLSHRTVAAAWASVDLRRREV